MSDSNPTLYEEDEESALVSDSDSEAAEEGRPEKITKKTYKQQFRSQWLEDPEFKNWLVRPRPGENVCSCKVCNKSLSCRRTALRRHSQSAQHKKALSKTAAGKKQGNLVRCLQRQAKAPPTRKQQKLKCVLSLHNTTCR